MLRCEHYDIATGTVEQLTRDETAVHLADADSRLWIDLEEPSADELHWLETTFHVHPLAMEDIRKQRQRSKVDRYPDYYFVVMHAIHYHRHTHHVDTREIDILLGANYLVTVHPRDIAAVRHIRQHWEEGRVLHPTAPFLFYMVLDTVVDSYFPVIDTIGELIDDIDSQLFANPQQEVLRTIFSLRRSLLIIRKILGPLRDTLNEMIRTEDEGPLASAEPTRTYLLDVFDHVLRITDFADTYRDMLSGSLDAYQSSLSNRLNENMQRLTVAATVLATATVITGFYGMNLRGLLINSPWTYGGHFILGLLLVITAIEIWLFRRKGWL